MEPNSISLVVVLLVGVAGLFFLLIRFSNIALRVVSGLLVVALSAGAGMVVVNDYYGYYQTWSQLYSDLSGSYSSFSTSTATRTVGTTTSGRVVSMELRGARSGIDRRGLVYLPPQYFEPRFAHTTFPVVELIHGSPGHPGNWLVQMQVAKTMDELLAHHQVGPMILVMPNSNQGTSYQECLNSPSSQDDTYVTDDVRTDVLAHLRASRDGGEWGIAGYSSGGYCAANLALRHRTMFGAAAALSGYFRPQDGPAAGVLHDNRAAEAANDPLATAAALPETASPLPAFWLSAGTGDRGDLAAAQAFVHALHGIEQVTLDTEAGAGHNFYNFAASLPRMLSWMWVQVASPDLRDDFPIAGAAKAGVLVSPPLPAMVAYLLHKESVAEHKHLAALKRRAAAGRHALHRLASGPARP